MNNPYPKTITDGVAGIQVANQKHDIWEEGYKAMRKELTDWVETQMAAGATWIQGVGFPVEWGIE